MKCLPWSNRPLETNPTEQLRLTWIYPGGAQGATTEMLLLWLSYWGTCFDDKGLVPQAEGQQGARLLVKFQMDALQLTCSHQLMRNNGRRTLTLQTVLPTPEKQRSVKENGMCQKKQCHWCCLLSYKWQMQNNCEDSIKVWFPVPPLLLETTSWSSCAELVCGRNLLRSLLNLPLAADGGNHCFGVEL